MPRTAFLPLRLRTRRLGWNRPGDPAENAFQGFAVGEPRDAALGNFSACRQIVQGRADRVERYAGCGGDLGVEALAVLSQVLKYGRVVHLDAPGEESGEEFGEWGGRRGEGIQINQLLTTPWFPLRPLNLGSSPISHPNTCVGPASMAGIHP